MSLRSLGQAGLVICITLNMVIIGIWHGLTLNFLVFGLMHAVFVIVTVFASRALASSRSPNAAVAGAPGIRAALAFGGMALTFALMSLSQIFWRSPTWAQAVSVLEQALGLSPSGSRGFADLGPAAGLMTGALRRDRPLSWRRRARRWARRPGRRSPRSGMAAIRRLHLPAIYFVLRGRRQIRLRAVLNWAKPSFRQRRGQAFRTVAAAGLTALLLDALVCFLPTSAYQRWESTRVKWYSHFAWCFERIHFDPTPIDVAVTGSSKTFFSVDPLRLERRLADFGLPAHVANLSKLGAGRNAEWEIVQELFAARRPKLLIVGVEDKPYPWGHPGFKDIAAAGDLLEPPSPLLHDYLSDLAALPRRQALLFAASLFPGSFGLTKAFDRRRYDETPTPWTARNWVDDLVPTDREAVQPAEKLVAERKPLELPTFLDRLLLKCCNDGDDKVYLRAIASLAKAKGVPLLFVHTPMYQGAETAEESDFVRQFGPLIDGPAIDDLRKDATNFENWRHFNRIGSGRLSDRIAAAIVDMRMISPPVSAGK